MLQQPQGEGIRGLLSIFSDGDDRRILGVLQFPEGDFFGRKIWQVFFLVWLQLGGDFRDKSRLYYASKIRSRLVLGLLEYSIYCKCIWCPGVGILPYGGYFFSQACLFVFFVGGGGWRGWKPLR